MALNFSALCNIRNVSKKSVVVEIHTLRKRPGMVEAGLEAAELAEEHLQAVIGLVTAE